MLLEHLLTPAQAYKIHTIVQSGVKIIAAAISKSLYFFVHFDACYGGLAAFYGRRGGPGPGIGPPNRRIIFNLFSVDFSTK